MITVKYYTATWCGPCKAFAPIIEQLKTELSDVNFVKIDIDINKNSIIEDDIASVPTIVITKDGKKVHRFTGVKPKSVVENIIKQFI